MEWHASFETFAPNSNLDAVDYPNRSKCMPNDANSREVLLLKQQTVVFCGIWSYGCNTNQQINFTFQQIYGKDLKLCRNNNKPRRR